MLREVFEGPVFFVVTQSGTASLLSYGEKIFSIDVRLLLLYLVLGSIAIGFLTKKLRRKQSATQ